MRKNSIIVALGFAISSIHAVFIPSIDQNFILKVPSPMINKFPLLTPDLTGKKFSTRKREDYFIAMDKVNLDFKVDYFVGRLRFDAFNKTYDAAEFCNKADFMKDELLNIESLIDASDASELLKRKLTFTKYMLKTMTDASKTLMFYERSSQPGSGLIYAVTGTRIKALALLNSEGKLDVGIRQYEVKVRRLWRIITYSEGAFSKLRSISPEATCEFNSILNEAKLCIYALIGQIPGFI